MHPAGDLELLLRLAAAALVGALLGAERQVSGHNAGLRTHMLVSMGSAAFTIAGAFGFGPANAPDRVAAQIVSGIGFLGAGTIWRSPDGVHGLTTAAGIWLAASLGMLIAVGAYALAVGTALVALVVLVIIRPIERASVAALSRRLGRSSAAARPAGEAVRGTVARGAPRRTRRRPG